MRKSLDTLSLQPLEEIDLSGVDLSGGISVFLPAYNEEGNIERAVSASSEMLKSITDNYEVLVVNDASTDRTLEIVERMARNNSHIRIITHKRNTRLGGAIQTGFFKSSKSIVFYCDADNPVSMWDVKRSLPLLAKYDLITGYRLNREETLRRKIYSMVYNSLTGLLFSFSAEDINFSFKLVKREALNKIELHSRGGFIDVEFIVEVLRHNFRVCQVGVKYYPRQAGVSTMASPSVIIEIFQEMWAYIKRTRKKS